MKLRFTLFMSMIMFSVFALCQAVTPPPLAVIAPPAVPVPPSWLVNFASSHPWVLSVLVVVGSLRLLLKPIFSGLHVFFEDAGLTSYDAKETAIEQSKPVQMLFFILDYLGSIKIPVQAPPQVVTGPVAPVNSQPPSAS